MRAMQLKNSANIADNPLHLLDLPDPLPRASQIRLKVQACGLCHTDLHIVEGELAPHLRPLVPGHQIVGIVDSCGEGVTRFQVGDRVGVPWLYQTCGRCKYCLVGKENLCETARFTGYDVNGGYAEYHVVDETFAYPLPASFDNLQVAPLLCAGVIGYRTLHLAEVQPGSRVGLYGFGASAHICLQILNYWQCETYVFTRGQAHQDLALQLGAKWVGAANDNLPLKLDHSLIFAPAGSLVVEALKNLDKGGTLALGGIHMSDIPTFPYSLLWGERTVRSVANSTRRDVTEFLGLAAKIPVSTHIEIFELPELNAALQKLKAGQINGSGVIKLT